MAGFTYHMREWIRRIRETNEKGEELNGKGHMGWIRKEGKVGKVTRRTQQLARVTVHKVRLVSEIKPSCPNEL